jgi:predicted phage-related endonuclease
MQTITEITEEIQATEEEIIKLTALRDKGLKKRIIDIKGLSVREWLILRSLTGVGCSEIATVLGKSPFPNSTPLSVWKQKVSHIIQIKDNSRMRIGRNVEEAIVLEYEALTGLKVQRVKDFMFLHPEFDNLFANLDGIIPPVSGDPYGVLEAKSTVSYIYETWLLKLPTYYFRQAMGEISVLDGHPFIKGAEVGFVDFATLILDKRVVEILRINKDGEFIKQQTIDLNRFWNDFVVTNIAPDLSVMEYAVEEPMIDSYVTADDMTYNKLKEVLKLSKQIKALEEQKDELADEVKLVIADNESLLYDGSIVATWKSQHRSTIDSKKLKANYPEIAEECEKKSVVRVFRPKELDILQF